MGHVLYVHMNQKADTEEPAVSLTILFSHKDDQDLIYTYIYAPNVLPKGVPCGAGMSVSSGHLAPRKETGKYCHHVMTYPPQACDCRGLSTRRHHYR